MSEREKIDRFVGDFAFLSNFFPSTITVDGVMFKTAEHAYQAQKAIIDKDVEIIASAATPGVAKTLGRKITIRSDWDSIKVDVMKLILREKFKNPILRELLLMTGDAELVEFNEWNDRFWGVCKGVGENRLGILLQEIREEIKRDAE